jgi:hypothetical protein
VRPILILLMTSTATVVCTWLSIKLHFGFIGAWVIATVIIFVGSMMTRGKSAY